MMLFVETLFGCSSTNGGRIHGPSDDVIMLDLNEREYVIHNLDIEAAEKQTGGNRRVPIMDVERALAKYGKIHHDVGVL
ncbi:MAG: hypothetical protein OEQ28_08480 [Acidobacteriota bacterium]|nr:hypothetical protein [Acidobacteriota bacterium]